MHFLGMDVQFQPRWPLVTVKASPVIDNRGAWWPWIQEPYTGAWQRNQEIAVDTVLAYHAVYACITLIAADIAKLRIKLVSRDTDGIWSETESSAFSPVLRKPNHYQTRIQFIEWWIFSKLIRGNTYVLKERDNRGIVRRFYLLDPTRVKPLVSPDGSVLYDLQTDSLSGLTANTRVPASEIIHDRMNCIFHPLIGTSPIFACGAAANVGLQIQHNSANFFAGGSNPSGILTAPGKVTDAEAKELSQRWNAEFSGRNAGKVAVVGNGLTFEQLRMSAVDAQLIEHLKWTAETVCSVFHVPPFKISVGQMPTYSNGEILDQRYYSDCLQSHIEHLELLLDEGLGLDEPKEDGRRLGVELDLDGLLRMDTATQFATLGKGVGGGFLAPNEARRKLDLRPLTGGDTVYLQQQNYSMEALAKRDQSDDPFGTKKPEAPAAKPPADPDADPDDEEEDDEEEKAFDVLSWETKIAEFEAARV